MNLETIFEKYLRAYVLAHRGALAGGLEEELPGIYDEWKRTPSDDLGGKTPEEYAAGLDVRELTECALANVRRGGEPSPVAADRLVEMPGAAAALERVLSDDGEDERVREAAADLLVRADALPVATCVDAVFDPDTPAGLRESLVEKLKYEKGVADVLLERLSEAEGDSRLILAELLASSGVRDDRIYDMLVSMLGEPGLLPFACRLLSAYGDERAIEPLVEASHACDYADYTDLRCAVEELGGDMPLRFNWDNDPTYRRIKGK